jgi:outer membrane protein OmpA-like peptidoglycan-associated protein
MIKHTALLTAAALAVTACATAPYGGPPLRAATPTPKAAQGMPRVGTRTATGIAVGAGAGALLGYLTNTNSGEQGRKNALIGAGIGALAGGVVGNYMDRQQAQLQQQLAGSDVRVVRQGENIVLQMPGDVTFAFNDDRVQPQFYPILDQVASTLNQYPQTLVDIVGHADSVGADAYNQNLSERRASSVAGYMLSRQVLRDRPVRGRPGRARPDRQQPNRPGPCAEPARGDRAPSVPRLSRSSARGG